MVTFTVFETILENDQLILYPLKKEDFESLYALASDPKIWEQHPRNDRWKKPVFQKYFDEAIQRRGAFKIMNKQSGEAIGCTSFYKYKAEDDSIMIGYTFYATSYWGKGINPAVKKLMLDYIFQFVSKVNFHTSVDNLRSQIAISRLGAKRVAKEEVNYPGEPSRINYLYSLDKADWIARQKS